MKFSESFAARVCVFCIKVYARTFTNVPSLHFCLISVTRVSSVFKWFISSPKIMRWNHGWAGLWLRKIISSNAHIHFFTLHRNMITCEEAYSHTVCVPKVCVWMMIIVCNPPMLSNRNLVASISIHLSISLSLYSYTLSVRTRFFMRFHYSFPLSPAYYISRQHYFATLYVGLTSHVGSANWIITRCRIIYAE